MQQPGALQSTPLPAVAYVDDENALIRVMTRFLRDEPIDFRAVLAKDDGRGRDQVLTWAEELGDRLRLVLVDGTMFYGSHGIDVVEALDRAGRLARREDILREGRVERSKLAAVMMSGGLPNPELSKRTNAALQDGRISVYLSKPPNIDSLHDVIRGFVSDPMSEAFLTKLRARAGGEWDPPQDPHDRDL